LLNGKYIHLTKNNNFRVRLLLNIHGLVASAARFQNRRGDLEADSSTCRLEESTHFMATCLALELK